MKNIKRFAALTIVAGGLAVAGAGVASAQGPQANGGAMTSPGAVSGNNIQAPIHVPVNVCSNTISVIGAMNPAFGVPCGR
ncbi:chaplin [Streptomyces sp. DSM 41524]|uniref:Chaplin n=1 Tax=Streptomyces asiaticus subsp. ignotus TaxID=3098222 RepID=A0ABU7Q6S8_9ACTN|nr:chaplin [Streptomyces sp. DASNCL29]MEE4597058.1 chaplin [Streptomyces sp. DSM 41524]TMU97836.1 chaplin [Streptomyces sp. DASNCL29]